MKFDTSLGVTFERVVDGSVLIRCDALEIEVPPAIWAQAVASVSARGESLDLIGEALQMHQRRE